MGPGDELWSATTRTTERGAYTASPAAASNRAVMFWFNGKVSQPNKKERHPTSKIWLCWVSIVSTGLDDGWWWKPLKLIQHFLVFHFTVLRQGYWWPQSDADLYDFPVNVDKSKVRGAGAPVGWESRGFANRFKLWPGIPRDPKVGLDPYCTLELVKVTIKYMAFMMVYRSGSSQHGLHPSSSLSDDWDGAVRGTPLTMQRALNRIGRVALTSADLGQPSSTMLTSVERSLQK